MEGLGLDLANDPIADHEEISTFLNEQGQLKRLSDVYEHLVRRRDEKETELKNLKSKGDRTVRGSTETNRLSKVDICGSNRLCAADLG